MRGGGGGCTKSKINHVSGCLPTGKQAEMESRLNFHSDRTLTTKVQGGCNEIEILEPHVMDYEGEQTLWWMFDDELWTRFVYLDMEIAK